MQSRGEELQSSRSQISMLETDLQAVEKERDGLAKKVEMLERALESPGSKMALRRILERWVLERWGVFAGNLSCYNPNSLLHHSPMPDPSGRNAVPADFGASPLLQSRQM